MRKWLESHKWYFIWIAVIAFYLLAVVYRAENKGVQLCIGHFCSVHFESILLCVGLASLFLVVWLFFSLKVKIIISIVLVLLVLTWLCTFAPLQLLTSITVHKTYTAEDGTQIVLFKYFPDGVIEYERCGILAFRISDDIGLLQGLKFLFWNNITVCFAVMSAGIIFIKKLFVINAAGNKIE
ncbi:MAG: hypothetical protein IKV74_00920 [Clostridia bacterium]|nr:hypothetical protein [Clostridia bacterium]